jgi:hypothetical protein
VRVGGRLVILRLEFDCGDTKNRLVRRDSGGDPQRSRGAIFSGRRLSVCSHPHQGENYPCSGQLFGSLEPRGRTDLDWGQVRGQVQKTEAAPVPGIRQSSVIGKGDGPTIDRLIHPFDCRFRPFAPNRS